MRKAFMVLVCFLAMTSSAYVAFAQAEHQIDDKGWIEIGSKTETATKKRPTGSLYRGNGGIVYAGKPPKPYIQHDMVGYEVDPAPAADRNKPYNKRLFGPGTWEGLVGGMGSRVPPMTDLGYKIFESHIFMGGPRGALSLGQQVNDPELICDPDGYLRGTFAGRGPIEWFQFPTETLVHHVWHETWTKIWTDGRLLPKAPIDPAFMGYSVGKWVGDTFVVDTNGVDDRTWMGQGLGHTLNAEFQARWRRIDHNTLQMNMTIKDPEVFKETWNTPDALFELYPNLEADIWPCVPSDELKYRELSPTEVPDAGKK